MNPRDSDLPELSFEEREPSQQVSALIRAQVHQDLAPIQRLSKAKRVAISFILFCLILATLGIFKSGDGVHFVTRNALLGACGWALVTLSILVLGFGQFGRHARLLRLMLVLAVPLCFFTYLTLIQTSRVALSVFVADSIGPRAALDCGGHALLLGAVTSVGVFLTWRRTDPFNPGWSGALVGLVGGLAGALSVGLVCPDNDAWHLWLGHGLSVIALTLASATFGRRLLAP
jgi:hypothetical protein